MRAANDNSKAAGDLQAYQRFLAALYEAELPPVYAALREGPLLMVARP